MRRKEPLHERFWKNVDTSDGPAGCWLWQASYDADGYGRAYDGKRGRRAHALALELSTGVPVPLGAYVLHSCDNPPCCNPTHLRRGTAKDNKDDATARGRSKIPYVHTPVPENRRPKGDRNGSRKHPERLMRGEAASRLHAAQRKLTVEAVLSIRRGFRGGTTITELAREYGVGVPQVHRIVNRTRWSWLPIEEGTT